MSTVKRRRGAYQARRRNPLGLSDRELQAVTALTRLGTDRAVAREFGVRQSTVSRLLASAQRHAGVANRVQLALAWDRMWRGAQGRVVSVFQLGQQALDGSRRDTCC